MYIEISDIIVQAHESAKFLACLFSTIGLTLLSTEDFLGELRFNYSPPGIKFSKGVSDAENLDSDEEEGDGRPDFEAVAGGAESLDKVLEASGFTRKDQETLEQVSSFTRLDQCNVLKRFWFPSIDPHFHLLLPVVMSGLGCCNHRSCLQLNLREVI